MRKHESEMECMHSQEIALKVNVRKVKEIKGLKKKGYVAPFC